MSAMNVFVTPEAAHVFTDGGMYEPNAMVLEGFGNKVAVLPQLSAVIAATGYSFVPATLAFSLVDKPYRSFDGLAADFSSFVRKAAPESALRMGGPASWGHFEVILAGWSESENAPRAIHLCGYAKNGWPAFRVQECTRFCSPSSIGVARDFEFDPAKPAESGLKLMRIQRMLKATPVHKIASESAASNPDDLSYVVSGFAQHMSVSREGITIRVLDRWPDKIGEKISPV